MAPGRLRLIRGDAGSGKAQVAAEMARLHERAGWQVLTVAPTGAGLEALEKAGVERPRTLRRFMAETVVSETVVQESVSGDKGEKPRVQLDPATVVVLSHANRLGAREMAGLLERVEASGAKLVAFLGGEEQLSMEAGAVVRALEMRVGSAWMGKDRLRDSGGMMVVSGLVNGGMEAENALEALVRFGSLVAGGTARRAVDVLADSYVADPNPDRIALTWGRADAQAVTQAIRAKLDIVDPARAGFERHAALKPGDRIRFLKPTPWVPPAERDADWESRRVRAGERAEVVARDDRPGSLVLRITARGGSETRDVKLTPAMDLPEWDYAFAGTIHGEGALVRENVHLLVSPSMSRQVLAAGVAAHAGDIKLVVPSSEVRMGEVMNRIVRREGRAESVLDYGFDPCFGAREAMRGRSVEVSSVEVSSVEVNAGEQGLGEEIPPNNGIDSAITRLAQLAGIKRAAPSPAPSSALGQGLEAEVLAEVIGAAVLREGQAPGGKDRLAVERYVRVLGDGRDWRRLLRQVPAGLPGQADMLARAEAGEDSEGRLLGTARVLARGALTARALGEERVAGMFEAGLALYGKRAEMARVHGRMDALLPERVDAVPGQDLPDPKDRPETPDARRRRAQREWARNRRRTRGRRRGLLSEIMAGVNASDEQVARMALEIWGVSDRPRRRARTMAYAWEVEALRKEQAEAQDVEQAAPDRPQEAMAAGHPVAASHYTEMAHELAGLMAAYGEASNALQTVDMDKRLAALLERADRQVSSPWSKPGVAAMGDVAVWVVSLRDLEGEDKVLARAVGAALARGALNEPAPEPPEREAPERDAVVRVSEGGKPKVQAKEADDPTVPAQEDVVPESRSKAQERAEAAPEQLSLPLRPTFGLPPVPSQGDGQGDLAQQPGPSTGAARQSGPELDQAPEVGDTAPAGGAGVTPGPDPEETEYRSVDRDAFGAEYDAETDRGLREMEEADRLEDMWDEMEEAEMTEKDGKGTELRPTGADLSAADDGALDASPEATAPVAGEGTRDVAPAVSAAEEGDLPPGPDLDETGYTLPDWETMTGEEHRQRMANNDPELELHSSPADVLLVPNARREQRALALQIAIGLSRAAPADDPVHARDLPRVLGYLIARGDFRLVGGDSYVKQLTLQTRFEEALGHPYTSRDEARLIHDLSLKYKVDDMVLPDYDKLIRGRREVLDAFLAADRPTAAPRALIRKMEQVFTQLEIRALRDVSQDLPESLTGLRADPRAQIKAETRARISEYLAVEVKPQKGEQGMDRTGEEKTMDQQQGPRGSDAAREDILSALLLNDVSKTTFTDLRKAFTFDEIRALKDPTRALPEDLPDLTQGERKTIAKTLAAGPSGKTGPSGASRFEPDPRYDGRALQLATAITERVDAQDPVHQRNLVVDIRALLRAADAAAATLPAEKVTEVTRELTTARVTLEAKLALAARLDGDKFNRPLFLGNVGRRNPYPGQMHPLEYAHKDVKDAYDRDAEGRVKRALSESPEPTQAELSVARIAVLPNPPKRGAELVEALKYVFREGSLKPVDELMKEREALLAEIADTKESPKKSEDVLERVFRTFTHKEVFALAQPNKSLPGTVPALDENRRIAVARGITTITKTALRTPGGYAWGAAGKSLENGLHPERARSRSRGMGMSM